MNKPEAQAPTIRASRVYLVLALCIATQDLYAGTFTFSKDRNSEGKNCSIEYSGRIENTDIEKLRRVLKDAETRVNFNRHIHLNSKGGDLNAALELGKLIRSHDLITFVLEECFSSCVIAFAGGVWRNVVVEAFGMPLAKIGIHRPFLMGHVTTIAERRKEFNTLAQSVKTFLREGGVSETLWDDMVKTPPENMRLLSQEDVIHYGLLGKIWHMRTTWMVRRQSVINFRGRRDRNEKRCLKNSVIQIPQVLEIAQGKRWRAAERMFFVASFLSTRIVRHNHGGRPESDQRNALIRWQDIL